MDQRLLVLHLELIRAQIDVLLEHIPKEPPPPEPDPFDKCPRCSETERIEDTSVTGAPRRTCLTCGISWSKEVVSHG